MGKLDMRFQAKYGSHLPVLVKLLSITAGPVLELGGGWCSTPVLHWLCAPAKRRLVTYDNDPAMFRILHGYQSEQHEIYLVDDWDKAEIEQAWDVVLVDHAPALRRKEDIKRLAKYAKFLAVHDTSWKVEKNYHYSEIWPLFRYRCDYTAVTPYTTILSNFVDLKDFSV